MSTVTPMPRRGSARDMVAGEVRAELARARISGNRLVKLLGGSQSYWSRRITGTTPLDVDDLERLATLLGVPVARFFGAVDARGPRPDGPDGGLDATWCAASDSNREPTDSGWDVLADVVPLAPRVQRDVERRAPGRRELAPAA